MRDAPICFEDPLAFISYYNLYFSPSESHTSDTCLTTGMRINLGLSITRAQSKIFLACTVRGWDDNWMGTFIFA
jgi:hypothetical protein